MKRQDSVVGNFGLESDAQVQSLVPLLTPETSGTLLASPSLLSSSAK